MKYDAASFGDFRCAHCQAIVSSASLLSGVNNRNHCPYCMWSCHLDLYSAGDRLSSCKAPMKPLGVTMKKSRNKYQREARGELMLIHECAECKALSINRLAADDDSETILSVFEESLLLNRKMHIALVRHGIVPLQVEDRQIVYSQLYGQYGKFPMTERV